MIAENQQSEFFIERLNESNLADMVQLHNTIYGRNTSVNYFLQKYNTSFTRVKYIGFLAYNHQKTAVGYYGVIPVFIKSGDEIILSAQSADTMTHPGYRFKRLFTDLALLTYQLCVENNIRFVFGFPNQNSLPGFINKLDWKVIDQMDCFIINSGAIPLVKASHKIAWLKNSFNNYQKSRLNNYISPQKGISTQFLGKDYSGVFRDQNYLSYKAYGNTYVLKIANALLWVKINQYLLIGDMQVDTANFEEVMELLKELGRELFISEIHFHTSPGTKLHSLFSKQFTAIPSFQVIVKNLSAEPSPKKIKFTSADIDTF